jgi:putative lipoic acid-binding regulatory protein
VTDGPRPLIEYPGPYPFKVIGRLEPGFREYLRRRFSELLGSEVPDEAIAENISRQSTYVSLTVTVVLTSEEQRRAIYQQLHEDPRVLYTL